MARGELVYPEAFTAGVVEGLMLDYNGYVRAGAAIIADIRNIISCLPVDSARAVLGSLSSSISEAAASYALSDDSKREAVAALSDWGQAEHDDVLREKVEQIELRMHSL